VDQVQHEEGVPLFVLSALESSDLGLKNYPDDIGESDESQE
jgi:hypothetical protein